MNNIKIILILFIFPFFVLKNAYGQNADIKAYRFFKDINNINISVPTVLEVEFPEEFIERFNFAILDRTTNSFEPYFFKKEVLVNEIPLEIKTDPVNIYAKNMIDKNIETYAEFLLDQNQDIAKQKKVDIFIKSLDSSKPIISSSLKIVLDKYVALPNSLEIKAFVNGKYQIVLANDFMFSSMVYFPKTASNEWIITFYYSQPLRISELNLIQENAVKQSINSIRFLAQPGHSYRIYFDPDRDVYIPTRQGGNLSLARDVLLLSNINYQNNPDYVMSDFDNDGIPDKQDNCVNVKNSDQKDLNNNKIGDVCEDFDYDGILNFQDNCVDLPNADQIDTDNDGIGDVCDKEESRFTERYPWIPWLGIGFAGIVLIILFVITAKSLKDNKE